MSSPKNTTKKQEILAPVPAATMQLAKNDLARAKNNMSSKKKNKNVEENLWDDFGGGSTNKSNNDDLLDFGSSVSNSFTQNNKSSANNNSWDAWDEPAQPVKTSNILKPTKAKKSTPAKKKAEDDDWGNW